MAETLTLDPAEYTRCPRCGEACRVVGHVCDAVAPRPWPERPREDVAPLPVVGRARCPRDLGDAPSDLELLAAWAPLIEARAIDPTPTVPTGQRLDGRPDAVDARHHDLADALRVMARLGALPRRDQLVLYHGYVHTDAEARLRWGGWHRRVGLVFALPRQRVAWLTQPELRFAAERWGAQLTERAVQAYAVADPEVAPPTDVRPPPPSGWRYAAPARVDAPVPLADLRATVTALCAAADAAERGAKAAAPTPAQGNRAARRKAAARPA